MFRLLEGIAERHEIMTILQAKLTVRRSGLQLPTRQLLEEFLLEKKRERRRRSRELQYLENCKQQKITNQTELNQFYRIVSELMRKQGLQPAVAEGLPATLVKKQTVQMFVRFFEEMGNHTQAEMIDRIFRKNVCSVVVKKPTQDCLIPTLVSWFYEWARRRFEEIIVDSVNELQREESQAEARRPNLMPVSIKAVPKKELRRSMSPNRRIEQVLEICKTITVEREVCDQKEEPLHDEKISFDITKDYYYGVLSAGLTKLYRQYDSILGLDQLFVKRFKKVKYEANRTAGLVELAICEFQQETKQSIAEYALQYRKKVLPKQVSYAPHVKKNSNSMHTEFNSTLKHARRPIVNNRYQLSEREERQPRENLTELQEPSSSLLLPTIPAADTVSFQVRRQRQKTREKFLLNIYSKRNDGYDLSSRRYLQLSKTIDKLHLQSELDLLHVLNSKQQCKRSPPSIENPKRGQVNYYFPRLPK